MTLPASGAISLGQVNTELGFPATNQISLADDAVQLLFRGVIYTESQLSMDQGHGDVCGALLKTRVASGITTSSFYGNGTILAIDAKSIVKRGIIYAGPPYSVWNEMDAINVGSFGIGEYSNQVINLGSGIVWKFRAAVRDSNNVWYYGNILEVTTA